MRRFITISSIICICLHGLIAYSAPKINLAGKWQVTLPDNDVSYSISLPGTTDDAGLGIADTLSPLLKKPQLLHLTRKNRFVGNAAYSRSIDVPKDMAGKPLKLSLERVLWKSCLSVDGKPIGDCQESLTTPHEFIIPEGLTPGTHTLTLNIDNTKQYEISTNNLAHAYTDDTQIMWNGVLGDMTLSVIPDIEISDLQVYPDVNSSAVLVKATINNSSRKRQSVDLDWQIDGLSNSNPLKGNGKVRLALGENRIEFLVKDQALSKSLWSEFNPHLLSLKLNIPKSFGSSKEVRFGMREFASKDKKLTINGIPVFLRGTLECCVFPLTGTPPTKEEGWKKVFETAKSWGLNHLRFHSWCPPEAAFNVADSIGFYLQVECPLWSVDILPGKEGANGEMKNFILEEYNRIVKNYGNHPSFCMMTVGNELQKDFDWLNEMTEHMHQTDPRHLYAVSSFTFEKGHGGHAERNDDFIVTQWTDDGWVRGQGVFDKEPPSFNKNYASSIENLTVPLVEHEIGQYAVYPDLSEIDKYTGVLDPMNFKAIKLDLEKKGKLHRADEYLNASGQLAAILYKEEIERALKTPGVSGIQLLGLQDFPGQGTALVGLVNAFWDSKGIVDAEWFRRFCSPVVPLADFEKAVYTDGETFTADIKIAQYSPAEEPVDAIWRIKDGGKVIAENSIAGIALTAGINEVGKIELPLNSEGKSKRYELSVEVPSLGARNSWNIWVYPENDNIDFGEIVATDSFNEAMKSARLGKKVLFSPSLDSIDGKNSKFVPVFWSPVHFPNEAGAMGILCNPNHNALASFPNDGHTDWQWWHPIKRSKYVDISGIEGVTPIIEMVDNFTTNRDLAVLFETKIGDGSIIFSGINFLSNGGNVNTTAKDLDHASRQLLTSIVDYMKSSSFTPTQAMSEIDLMKLLNISQ